MNYKKVLPEILLDLGEKTEFDNPMEINKKIIKLHINLENWRGDDLLWNFPETIVTQSLKENLESSQFTGFSFDDILITKDIYFDDNYHLNKPLPKFYWMKIHGVEGLNDFYLKSGELHISENALNYITNNFSIGNIQIEPQKNEFDDFILGLLEKDKRKLNDDKL